MSGGKLLLVTIVFVPIMLGMLAARERRVWPALQRLLVTVFAFDLAYLLLLYYLDYRW